MFALQFARFVATPAFVISMVLFDPVSSFSAPKCSRNAHPIEIEVELDPGVVKYDIGKSKWELTRMATDPAIAGRDSGTRSGLTRSSYSAPLKIGTRYDGIGGGWKCHRIESVDAKIEVNELVVFVARELRSGTCAYNAVLEHEERHVKIFRDTLNEYLPAYEKALRRGVKDIPPVASKNGENPGDGFLLQITARLKPVLAELSKTLRERQAAIDSPREYRLVHDKCRTW